ncbi:MAG TPA: hypothetical protein VF486_01365 [Actinomycetes bacterium]
MPNLVDIVGSPNGEVLSVPIDKRGQFSPTKPDCAAAEPADLDPGCPASALGLIEGVADGLAGAARLGGAALADDPGRRRAVAVGGYTTTAVLSSLLGAATAAWQVGVLRAGAWAARGVRWRPPC